MYIHIQHLGTIASKTVCSIINVYWMASKAWKSGLLKNKITWKVAVTVKSVSNSVWCMGLQLPWNFIQPVWNLVGIRKFQKNCCKVLYIFYILSYLYSVLWGLTKLHKVIAHVLYFVHDAKEPSQWFCYCDGTSQSECQENLCLLSHYSTPESAIKNGKPSFLVKLLK